MLSAPSKYWALAFSSSARPLRFTIWASMADRSDWESWEA